MSAAVKAAADAYRIRGWSPIPIVAHGKVPPKHIRKGWQHFVATDQTPFDGNVGNILGDRSNGLTDADLDCAEAIALAPAFLPETDAVFGRASKPSSHWLYRCAPAPKKKQFETKDDGMLCELRSNGCQTVFPPSVHECGETVEWVKNGEPREIDGGELLSAVRTLAGVTLLARHWPAETARFNAEGALIGALLRSGRSEGEVIAIMHPLIQYVGAAPRTRIEQEVPRLARRLRDGSGDVAGLPRLAEIIGDEIVKKVAAWLDLRHTGKNYEVHDSGFVLCGTDSKGQPLRIQLSNFTAKIAAVESRDDGSGKLDRRFAIVSGADRISIPADAFDSMSWLTEHWGPRRIVMVGHDVKAHTAAAIKEHSIGFEERTIFAHLGWRKIDGRWLYLHSGGAVGAGGPVDCHEVDPGGRLVNYKLPATVRNLPAAVRASLGLRDLGGVGLLMLAATYRAPLCEFADANVSVFLEGATGSYKSAVSGVALAHFGAAFDGTLFPCNWTSTPNALEKISFIAKDVLLVVDDFKPSGTTVDVARLHQTAERLFRAAANDGGRDRMNADGSLRPTYWPRGMVMASGEDVPKGHSLRARMVIQKVKKDLVDLAALSRLQRAAADGLLAEAMAGFIEWLARHDLDKLGESLRERAVALRDELRGDHARTPDNVAALLLGIDVLAEFAVDVGAIDKAEGDVLLEQARAALVEQIGEQDSAQASEDPARRFVALLGEALAAGRVHLANRRGGGAPTAIEAACGWRQREYRDANGDLQSVWDAKGDLVGWIEGDAIWVQAEVVYAAVERLSREQGRSLGLTQATLATRLAEAGYVEEAEQKPVRAGGAVQRALRLHAQHVVQRAEAPTVGECLETFRGAAQALQDAAIAAARDNPEDSLNGIASAAAKAVELVNMAADPAEIPF